MFGQNDSIVLTERKFGLLSLLLLGSQKAHNFCSPTAHVLDMHEERASRLHHRSYHVSIKGGQQCIEARKRLGEFLPFPQPLQVYHDIDNLSFLALPKLLAFSRGHLRMGGFCFAKRSKILWLDNRKYCCLLARV